MSLRICLPGMVERGEVTPEKADEMGRLFDDIEQDFRRQFGDQAAAAMASDATLAAMEAAASRKRFLAGRAIAGQKAMLADIASYDGGRRAGAVVDPDAVAALISGDGRNGYSSADGRRQAIERRAFGQMAQLLQQFHTNVLGRVRHTAELTDVVREIFGHDSGNLAAREMAHAWMGAAEQLRLRFNAAGGAIGQLRNAMGYLPQSHDWLKVRKAGYRAWREAILPALDRTQMIDERTGLPFNDGALELALQDVFDTIRTDGWAKRDAGGMGGGSVANRRGDPRFLIFKDADSWMAYNDQFGTGTAFEAMTGHVKGMARDIAAMERFGPNPEAGLRWIRDHMQKTAALTDDAGAALTRAEEGASKVDRLWAEYNGSNRRPAKQWLANVGRAVRSYEVAVKMGSAIISAVPGDIGTQHIAARFNGLPFTRVLANQLKQLNPANAEHRLLAAQMSAVYEGWTDHAASQLRTTGSDRAAGTMGKIAEVVLRAQGLGVWTDTGRAAFAMQVQAQMHSYRALAFDQLDPEFRGMFERAGIGPDGWDRIRQTPAHTAGGADWLFASDISDTALGDRVIEMMADETKLAVQEADFSTRALMHENLRSGTPVGEFVSSVTLFKSFGVSMLLTHGRRMAAMSNWKQRTSYGLRLATTMTLAGAVSIQLREIVKGRDPRPMDDPAFWASAFLQGGGIGLLADALGWAVDPRENAVAETIAGPVAGTGQNIIELGAAAMGQVPFWIDETREDSRPNVGRKLIGTIRDQMPGGNIWYLRTALQRLWIDQLSEEIDPNYQKSWDRMHKRAEDQRTGYWWDMGHVTPDRMPDIANAFDFGGDDAPAQGETIQ